MRAAEHERKGTAGQDAGATGHPGPIRVDLVVTPRCFASGVAVTQDVLSTANVLAAEMSGLGPLFSVAVLSSDGRPVTSSSGVEIAVDASLDTCDGALVLVFGPGMADVRRVLNDIAEPDATGLARRLRAIHARGATVCASCSSTFLLAEAGILDGGSATTSWWLAPTFRARYPSVALFEDDLVVRSERVITAGAALAQVDLALHLVRELCGVELAQACARYLVVDGDRRSQAPFVVIEHLARNDELVSRAEKILREDLSRALPVRELARALGVTPRTLTRRFVSATGLAPARFLRRVRLETAAARLRATSESILGIAMSVGYDDDRAFRRAFTQTFGTTPARFRRA